MSWLLRRSVKAHATVLLLRSDWRGALQKRTLPRCCALAADTTPLFSARRRAVSPWLLWPLQGGSARPRAAVPWLLIQLRSAAHAAALFPPGCCGRCRAEAHTPVRFCRAPGHSDPAATEKRHKEGCFGARKNLVKNRKINFRRQAIQEPIFFCG